MHIDEIRLKSLGVPINQHDKLPDVILFDSGKKRLILVEAVTSHGPMTPKRVKELDEMFKNCPLNLIYLSAFPDFKEFKRHAKKIAWETEVWIVEFPDHIIHYNGDKFLEPH
jgi:hypothetical protein